MKPDFDATLPVRLIHTALLHVGDLVHAAVTDDEHVYIGWFTVISVATHQEPPNTSVTRLRLVNGDYESDIERRTKIGQPDYLLAARPTDPW